MRRLLTLPYRVIRRFFKERFAQTAAALSFATLLGLVPMVAVAAAVMIHLPLADSLLAAIQKFLLTNLLPEKAGGIIARYLSQFAVKAQRLTWIGVIALIAAALAQMLTIEHTFNGIWGIKMRRPVLRRIYMHLLALVLGPLVFGASIGIITYATSASLGFVDMAHATIGIVIQRISFAFMVAIFALLYWKVPHREVSGRHAFCGGVIAAAGFILLQKLFSGYVIGLGSYRIVYGAFAAIPIFLLWLHLSWSVILLGALVVADLGRHDAGPR
ncbi:MAG: YihY family inner membrane protein [Proteobacteria bacterium]|nr:YihY family inner membrane protein [Pseudomonadota bacterium]HQR02874.1 YihY family inner membrane protein [Rhodocyclaceae bacterium]